MCIMSVRSSWIPFLIKLLLDRIIRVGTLANHPSTILRVRHVRYLALRQLNCNVAVRINDTDNNSDRHW